MLGHWTMIGEPRYGLMKPGQNIPWALAFFGHPQSCQDLTNIFEQIHFRYWSPGIKTLIHDRIDHNSPTSKPLFLPTCSKQVIHQQSVHARFIPFHSCREYRIDYAIRPRQHRPPFHARCLRDNLYVCPSPRPLYPIYPVYLLSHNVLTAPASGFSSARPWCAWIISIWASHMPCGSPCSWQVFLSNPRSLSLNLPSLLSSGSRSIPITTRITWLLLLNGVSIHMIFACPLPDIILIRSIVIAFVFTGYILSLIVDLMPSAHKNLHNPKGYQPVQMSMALP